MGKEVERMGKEVALSHHSSAGHLQGCIESILERRQGRTYGPAGGRACSVLITDVSMPHVNRHGHQATAEMLRELVEDRVLANFQKPGEWKFVRGLDYLATMATPGGGRPDLPPRLKRHFTLVYVPRVVRVDLESIFGSIMRQYAAQEKATPEVTKVANASVSVTMKIFEQLMHIIQPTSVKFHHTVANASVSVTMKIFERRMHIIQPTSVKFHHTVSVRDISRLYAGVIRLHWDEITTRESFVRLWKHEAERAFTDKLVEATDAQAALQIINLNVSEWCGAKIAREVSKPTYFCCRAGSDEDISFEQETGDADAPTRIYEHCPGLDAAHEVVDRYLQRHNDDPATSDRLRLALFEYAVAHVLKILHVITLARGHALLLGASSTGKSSLTRLATYMAGHFFIQLSPGLLPGRPAFVELLKSTVRDAAAIGAQATILVTGKQASEAVVLDVINEIVHTGECLGMFSSEEQAMLVSEALEDSAKKRGYPLTLEGKQDALHFVLCFPLQGVLPIVARRFPVLQAVCHWIHFLPWPSQSFELVAAKRLQSQSFELVAAKQLQVLPANKGL
ncbi:P-loop containing dynein motor region D3-domain-containing protein [Baffinella frigidus]|nr:P-loop containing dynein motor region D3-domain-containing protein [Cryptophyta sp. CCMP2293]